MNWQTVLTILAIIATAISSGLALKFVEATKKLIRESQEFYVVLHDALADGSVSREELVKILDEADDIPVAIVEILKLFNK